jgi:hypothetical protein
LRNKVFTFLHIEQKAAAGLGYTMAPEKPLASPQTAQFMGADRTITRRGVSRQGASTRARDCRASALRHTRDSGEAHIYLLDKKETVQKFSTVTSLKVTVCKVCSVRKISNWYTPGYHKV